MPAEPPVRRPEAAPAPIPARQPVPDGQPASRAPTADVAARPKPVASVERRVAQPGDRICGNCAEPNDPTRRFCRRCGTSLVEAQVVVEKRLPWWRRIFQRKPKPAARPLAAGDRVKSMQAGAGQGIRGLFKLRTFAVGILGVVVALGVVGYIGVPGVSSYVSQLTEGGIPGIIDKIQGFISPKVSIVHPNPADVTASDQVKGHEAKLVVDTFTNTDWQATSDTPSVTVKFKDKVDLSALIFHIGNADKFVDMRRPSAVQLTFSDGTTTAITLQDVHDPQTFNVSASGVTSVTIKVTGTYGPAGTPISISEIEFFKKG